MSAAIGLDIGSHSVKLIEFEIKGETIKLRTAGSIPTPPKALTSSLQAEREAVAVAVKKLYKDAGAKAKNVHVALPEAQVFTRVIEVPPLSKRELVSAIKWEAEQYIPLPLEQVNIDFSILREAKETPSGKMEVLLVAAPKSLIERYVSYIELAGLNVVGVETEIISTARALVRSTSTIKTAMIVSLGAKTTDFAILRSGVLGYTRSISSGGEALSRAITQGLGFQQSQAEEYKKAYGLDKSKLEGKIVNAVKPVMDTIISELKRAVAFYQEKYKQDRVEAIMLSGGTAKIPGMVVYVAESLGIETQLANPWVGVTMDKRFAVLGNEGPTFTVAVGLALRE